MFQDLITPQLTGVATETLTNPTAEAVAEPAKTPPTPPARFGATQVKLEADPDAPDIKIIECPRNDLPSDYVVYIHRDIRGVPGYYAELITLLRTMAPESSMVIFIGSPGGSLFTGAMIAGAIRACRGKVITVGTGLVASAAALIWFYGHKRSMMPGSVLMVHMSSHFDSGNSERIRLTAEQTVRYVRDICIDPMVREGVITPDEAEAIVDRRQDLYLDSATVVQRLEARHASV